jgi:hypothetical protein
VNCLTAIISKFVFTIKSQPEAVLKDSESIATNVGQFAVDSVLGYLHRVNVGSVADISGMCIFFTLSVAVWWVSFRVYVG